MLTEIRAQDIRQARKGIYAAVEFAAQLCACIEDRRSRDGIVPIAPEERFVVGKYREANKHRGERCKGRGTKYRCVTCWKRNRRTPGRCRGHKWLGIEFNSMLKRQARRTLVAMIFRAWWMRVAKRWCGAGNVLAIPVFDRARSCVGKGPVEYEEERGSGFWRTVA